MGKDSSTTGDENAGDDMEGEKVAKNKKDKLAAQKKADDLFGEAPSGEYDQYEDQYDDFF